MNGSATPRAGNVDGEERFAFGRNWAGFLSSLNESRIREAQSSLEEMLETSSLEGRSWIDVGSGSGLFSLAARRLGATVRSFDFDPESVQCTAELKRRYYPDDPCWTIEQGSILDVEYLAGLGQYDVVYAWGVLHHTGRMWEAMERVAGLVKPGGRLFIALYNRRRFFTAYWTCVKKTYHRCGPGLRRLMICGYVAFFAPALMLADLLRGRNPARRFRGEGQRGMSFYHDAIDWIGGWPYEAATCEEVLRFYHDRGFEDRRVKPCGFRSGCNQFVLGRPATRP
jgi:2-polyprenyl-6-hydroxyphenyl methylase/3-demethylubiquinone-9 3-methyltransferase